MRSTRREAPEARGWTLATLDCIPRPTNSRKDGEAMDLLDLRMGDVLRMRRQHPCGSLDWEVVRLGADIGLRCRGCQRRILMERSVLRRRARDVIERGPRLDPAIERAIFGDPSPESEGGDVEDAPDTSSR